MQLNSLCVMMTFAVALIGATALQVEATLSSEASVVWDAATPVPGYDGDSDTGTTSAAASDSYTGTNSFAETVQYSGSANSSAGYGTLTTYATATLTHGDTYGGESPATHVAQATSSFTETITAPLTATTVTYTFSVSGSVAFSADDFGNSNATVTATLVHESSPPFVRLWSVAYSEPSPLPFSTTFTTTPYPVTAGAPYTFEFDAESVVGFFHSGIPGASFSGNGTADFASTLVFEGFQFSDALGNPVGGLTQITGTSGTTYAVIPEPATLMLMVIAGTAMAATSRRRHVR